RRRASSSNRSIAQMLAVPAAPHPQPHRTRLDEPDQADDKQDVEDDRRDQRRQDAVSAVGIFHSLSRTRWMPTPSAVNGLMSDGRRCSVDHANVGHSISTVPSAKAITNPSSMIRVCFSSYSLWLLRSGITFLSVEFGQSGPIDLPSAAAATPHPFLTKSAGLCERTTAGRARTRTRGRRPSA